LTQGHLLGRALGLERSVSAAALVLVCTCSVVAVGVAQSPPDGATLYRTYCASCHGVSGRGNGPMAEYLRIPPTDLTALARRRHGLFDQEAVARAIDGRTRIGSHGPSDMPVWGDAFSSSLARGGEMALGERVRALTQHLATLQVQERPAP
jgi:mono/diheme cytochrome c family protein